MKLYAVRLFAENWTETVAFYRDTLAWPVVFEDEGMGWAEFDVGGPSIAIERIEPDDPEAKTLMGRFAGVSLQVDDIDALYAAWTDNGVEFRGPPARQPWGSPDH